MIALDYPPWLAQLQPETFQHGKPQGSLPLEQILRHSLFYPCSGVDIDAVRWLAGNFHSFVYADYSQCRDDLYKLLRHRGFHGYEVIAQRDVASHELSPLHAMPEQACQWMILQRREDQPATLGPQRLSLLYLCADATAAYRMLYVDNRKSAACVAVIQSHCGPMNGCWSFFADRQKAFARTVMENPAGKPRLLLYGGNGKRDFYREPCWDDYANPVCFLDRTGGGTVGVWQLAPKPLPQQQVVFVPVKG